MKAAVGVETSAAAAAAVADSVFVDVTLTAAAAAAAEVHWEMFADQLRLQSACCEGTLETGPAAGWPWSCGTVAEQQLG